MIPPGPLERKAASRRPFAIPDGPDQLTIEVTPSLTLAATSFTASTAVATACVAFFATLRAVRFARRFTRVPRDAVFFAEVRAEAFAAFRLAGAFDFAGALRLAVVAFFAVFRLPAALFSGRRLATGRAFDFVFFAGALRLVDFLPVEGRFLDEVFLAVAMLNGSPFETDLSTPWQFRCYAC